VKAWRITSRKTNRPTTLIRILTTNKDTIDDMLINGVELFGRTFECKTSTLQAQPQSNAPGAFNSAMGKPNAQTNKSARNVRTTTPQQVPC
jgi:hypothetical protein